jgi:hypothetical protein
MNDFSSFPVIRTEYLDASNKHVIPGDGFDGYNTKGNWCHRCCPYVRESGWVIHQKDGYTELWEDGDGEFKGGRKTDESS